MSTGGHVAHDILTPPFLSPVATKLQKGDIGLPSVSPSVRLLVWNTPSPSNPYLIWSGNQRRGTLSFTRMQFLRFGKNADRQDYPSEYSYHELKCPG